MRIHLSEDALPSSLLIYEPEEYEFVYFGLMRLGKSAVGDGEGREFLLQEGVEHNEARAKVFAAIPERWSAPDGPMIRGLIHHFDSAAALGRHLSVGYATLYKWGQGSPEIPFYVWRYLLEILGVQRDMDYQAPVLTVVMSQLCDYSVGP